MSPSKILAGIFTKFAMQAPTHKVSNKMNEHGWTGHLGDCNEFRLRSVPDAALQNNGKPTRFRAP
jgi:hypothetical protein